MKGMSKGSGTRSGLLWEVERLLNETKELPQILLMENVPQVHGKKNIADFEKWLEFLTSKGYKTFWQDLNAKDYGVAQSRNRCFAISLLGEYEYIFPTPVKLTKTVKDYLENNVDERYYIKTEKAKKLIDTLISNGKLPREREVVSVTNLGGTKEPISAKEITIAQTLCARDYKGPSHQSFMIVI